MGKASICTNCGCRVSECKQVDLHYWLTTSKLTAKEATILVGLLGIAKSEEKELWQEDFAPFWKPNAFTQSAEVQAPCQKNSSMLILK